MNFLNPKMG